MESLPLVLQRKICSFAAAPELIPTEIAITNDSHSVLNFATQLNEPSSFNLQQLSAVCRTWRNLITEFYREHELSCVFTLTVTRTTNNQDIIKKLISTGDKLLDLRIVLIEDKQGLWWDLNGQNHSQIQSQAQTAYDTQLYKMEWKKILRLCPNLRRLDLIGVPLHHLAMGNLLDAASTYCKYLEALILPVKDPLYAHEVADSLDYVFWKLYSALKKWKNASGGKGLRQLTVPSRSKFDRERTSNEYLLTVLTLCPQLEYLDGWKRSYNEGARLVGSDESLCVSRDVWKAFCKSCVALREFSWVVVPFSDEFFLPFGLTTKPNLTRLQLTYNTRALFRIRRNEYSTGGLNVLLSGCPALAHLDIVFHQLQPCDALIYPQIDEMIDPGVFNDDFVLALTDNCVQLQSLRIRELGALSSSCKRYVTAADAITDRGLEALWRAPNLAYIDIHDVRCSATAIFKLLSTDTKFCHDTRTRHIRLRELGVRFGELVQCLLDDLTRVPNQKLDNRLTEAPLVISLSSRQGYVFERSWLVKMQRAFQTRFVKGELCFVAFSLKQGNEVVFQSSTGRSNKQKIIAKLLARAWMKGDVLRLGRLVLYTHKAVLDKRLHNVLRKPGYGRSWILTE